MHHRIDTALEQLRHDVARHLDADSIRSACRSVGHTRRRCRLDPVAIVHWFVAQILRRNTAPAHISLLGGRRFTDSAYGQARARLPLAVLQRVLRDLVGSLIPDTRSEGLWRGHRTLLIDGSGFSMPDTPRPRSEFGRPGGRAPGCGFPVAKILALFHAGTGVLLKVVATPSRSHDMASVGGIPAELEPGDILVGDRGFCSFAHIALRLRGGFHAVFRDHQKQIIELTPGRPHTRPGDKGQSKGRPHSRWSRRLGMLDQVVELSKPRDRPGRLTAEEYAGLPGTLPVRELRYEVGHPGFRTRAITLVTTLLDADLYPSDALAALHRTRWQVELNLRHIKIAMKRDVLKCKTVAGVLKELTVYAIVDNLVCPVMVEAARRQGVEAGRISFVDALRWLEQAEPRDELPKLVVNPDRPDRVEPRVRKRRPKQYPVMQKPRSVLRKSLLSQGIDA